VANRERKIAERRFAEVRQLANKFIALDNEIRGLPGSTQVRMRMVADSLQYLSSYLGRHNVAVFGLEVGNLLRHKDAKEALAVYDHSLMRIWEAKPNASTQHDEAELLAASSYVLRWLGRENDAKQRPDRAFELLHAAQRYPADKVEPMSDSYDALRAQADDYAETGEAAKAIDSYRQLLDKMMAWGSDVQNDLREATRISRTWTALASLLRRAGRSEEAKQLEAQRADLWNHWNGKLPNAQALLRQSLSQVASRKAFLGCVLAWNNTPTLSSQSTCLAVVAPFEFYRHPVAFCLPFPI